MSNLAVPIEGPAPIDGILRELLKGASPGFFGELRFEICISVKAEQRTATYDVDKPALSGEAQPDADRIQKAKEVADKLASLLRYRQGTFRIVGQFSDGKIRKYQVIE